MKQVFKLRAWITASDRFSDFRTRDFYLDPDYETYEQAKEAIPEMLKLMEKKYNEEKFSNGPDGFYLSVQEFTKSNFSTIKYGTSNT